MSNTQKKTTFTYKVIKSTVRAVYPKIKVEGAENLPDEPAIIVGNHSQLHGPVACELYFPGYHYIWCINEMMHLKEVPDYAFADFWSKKPRAVRWIYRIVSYLIAPIAVCIFNNANCIPVYKDRRVIKTLRESADRLEEGANVIIFPEYDAPYNDILCDFLNGFVDTARIYYKKTNREISFVPMYLAPKLKTIYIGKPVKWNADADKDEERGRIVKAM